MALARTAPTDRPIPRRVSHRKLASRGEYLRYSRGRGSGSFVKRVLITGMSGVGKSSVIDELARRGYKAIDIDQPAWSEYRHLDPENDKHQEDDAEWLWKEDLVGELLATEDADMLFVGGCAANQGRFYPALDHVVLLTAAEPVMIERLATRTNNDFGKRPEELAKILSDKASFEARLRAGADVEIDTSVPLAEVVDGVVAVAEGREA